MRIAKAALVVASFTALGLTSCNAVMNLDRFESVASTLVDGGADSASGDAGDVEGDKDFVFKVVSMAPHPGQVFEFRIVDSNNRLQTRGIVDPLGEVDVTMRVPSSILQIGGPYRLDFYGDQNNSHTYDGLGSGTANDHAWRIPLVPSTKRGRTVEVVGNELRVTFVHDTVFTDIDTKDDGTPGKPSDLGLNATIHFAKLPASFLGVRLEVRILNDETGRGVGLFRFPQTKTPPFDAVIPGIIEGGVAYRILVYIDANGNSEYENPATGGPDKGYCVKRNADVTGGLNFEFDPDLAGDGTCDVGAP